MPSTSSAHSCWPTKLYSPQWMNMPNLASCHHAIRCARVAAALRWAAEGGAVAACGLTMLKAFARCAEYAIAPAPATPRCFRKSRLETASVIMLVDLSLRDEALRVSLRMSRGNYGGESVTIC